MFDWLAAAAKALKREVLTLYYAVQDERTPLLSKFIPWVALAYALSPIDLIPDFIPILGILDDLILLPGLIWLAIKFIPKEVMDDARLRAEREPLRLSSNWLMATMIFIMWMAGIEVAIFYAIGVWGSPELLHYTPHILGAIMVLCSAAFLAWLVYSIRDEEGRRKLTSQQQAKLVEDEERADEGCGPALAAEEGTPQGLEEPLLVASDP